MQLLVLTHSLIDGKVLGKIPAVSPLVVIVKKMFTVKQITLVIHICIF